MTILYGIPNCDTVKRARDWLATHGVEFEFHDFKKAGVPPDRLAAWVAAAQGHTTRAQSLATQAGDLAQVRQQYAREVMCRQAGIQFGDHGHEPRLVELSAEVSGPRVAAVTAWAAALARHDGTALMAVSSELESMGDRVAAADAAAHAAVAFRRQARRGATLTATARASRLVGECGARTLATTASSSPLQLSDREREVAVLVAQGWSSKQIAQHLVLSVRTVEGHLARMFTRLGLSGRAELARLIIESGRLPPSSGEQG